LALEGIVSQLKEERDRLERAISALEGGSGRRRGRPPGTLVAGGPRHRHMSAAARKKISEMMKKRWAERKRASKD
jgi:hypothetical protein